LNTTSTTLSSTTRELAARSRSKVLRALVLYLVLFTLLYVALRNAPFGEIWQALKQLQLWQIGYLLLINAGVILAMTARWWVIVRAENPSIPFLPLIKYRLAVFGLSYFTPGPQVGGEPLQVYYLKQYHGLTFARATSAVIMDKLLEFLANFILIGVGLTAAIRVGMVSGSSTGTIGSLIPMAVILLWPIIHLTLLHRGRYPISSLLRAVSSIVGQRDWLRLVIVSERMAASFTRRKLPALLGALFFSIIAWAGMAAEYFLMADFLQASLNFEQILAALTASLLAFLMPLPGGLGALEASQVYALTMLGYPASLGISLSLIMRARDILNGGLGLLLAGTSLRDVRR
jgi:uncharacterized protein (TIRG00374 family)